MAAASPHRRRRLGAGLLVLACATGVVLWQALDGDDGEREAISSSRAGAGDAGSPPSGSVPVVARADRLQVKSFSLLRTAPEGLPPEIASEMLEPTNGANWRLAQRFPPPAPAGFWLVPGRDTLCMVAREGDSAGINCTPTEHALGYALAVVVFRKTPGPERRGPPDRRLVIGISPDPTRRIRIHTLDSVATVPVVDGVFTLRDRVIGPPDRLTPLCPDGSRLKPDGSCQD